MLKRLTILTLAFLLVLSTASFAKDMTGKWGLGYFNSNAPVGVRFWATPVVGVDIGVGFNGTEVAERDTTTGLPTGETTTATSFWVEAGIPYVVFPGDRANFMVRPGLVFASLDDRSFSMGTGVLDDTWTEVRVSLTLAGEVFFGEHFSLEAGHGINVQLLSPPGDGDSQTNFSTFGASVSHLGFHYYFK